MMDEHLLGDYCFGSQWRLDNYNFDCFRCFTILVCMEDDYFCKMSDEVDMDMYKNMDDTVKNEACSIFLQLHR